MITIAVVGSHSALDVCRGAKDEGFKTLVIAQKGREKVYTDYYKTKGELGCVDEVLLVENFKDLLKPEIVKILKEKNVVFIPHRSFEVYVNNYPGIEKWPVSMFGNRFLLKVEERSTENSESLDQYKLLEKAGIRYPKQIKSPNQIDRLCIVKVLEKERGFERAFFLASSFDEYKEISNHMIESGVITEDQLQNSIIEEFIIGVQVNFNFFYDPINKRLELLGTDTRRQTNIEGINKIPSTLQDHALEQISVKYEEAGHIAVTVLESMLEPAFEIGEKFVKATQKLSPPGVIGPFGLQAMIIPGPPKKEIIVFDVSPRMPGSPGISFTPYSGYLFGENLSVGKRVAKMIKEAVQKGELDKIVT